MRSPLGTGFRWTGLFLSAEASDSMWIRERAEIHLPCALAQDTLVIDGELRPDGGVPEARGQLGLELRVGGRVLGHFFPPEGPFSWTTPLPEAVRAAPVRIELRLLGAGWSNVLAYLGRVCAGAPFAQRWQAYRLQPKNKRLRIRRLAAGTETIADFNTSATAFDLRFITRHANIGLNLVGWFNAALGVGESVRCAAKAAAAAKIPHALVPLKLFCKTAQGENAFDDRLQEANPYPVNVIHVDAPQTRDIDHHHGLAFSRGKHTVGYWAWELPEFPDGWVRYFAHVDEVWAPSRFARDAIAAKAPVPVFSMPHAIELPLPDTHGARAALGLPDDRFLFLFVYDLNSYAERKNPRAVIRAYREAFGRHGRREIGLVMKVHGITGNERDLQALRDEIADLDGCSLITETLPRARITQLQATCDAFVSLHRAEGFGLSVAECMYLGKPVISTDWSATAEFVTEENGCPVRAPLIELTENHGPYTKGQRWADPDVSHAAWHMRRLVEDRDLGQRLGSAAAATIRRDFSPARIGALYAERLRAMALW